MSWLSKLYRGVDTVAGGYLPGGRDPKDVTWRDSLGTLGDAGKYVAPFIPGVGTAAALGLGLAGELNDEDGFQPLRGLANGAMAGGAGSALSSVLGGAGYQAAAQTAGQAAKSAVASPGGALASVLRGVGSGVSQGAKWAAKNPNLALGVPSLALQGYAAHKQGRREDAEYDYLTEEREYQRGKREEEEERRKRMDPHRERILRLLMERMGGNLDPNASPDTLRQHLHGMIQQRVGG